MLRIRKEQLDALAKIPREDFYLRISKNVRELFPERAASMGFDGTMELIRKAVTAAEASGFVTESELALVVNLFFFLGPDFETRPDLEWVLDTLSDPDVSPAERLDGIYRELGQIEPKQEG